MNSFWLKKKRLLAKNIYYFFPNGKLAKYISVEKVHRACQTQRMHFSVIFFFCFWKFHFLFLSNKTLLNMFLTLIFFPNLLKTVIFSVQPIILKTIKNLKNWKFVAEKSKFSERKNLKIKSLKIFDYAWDIRRRAKLKTTIQNGRFSCFLAPIENRFFFFWVITFFDPYIWYFFPFFPEK